MCFACRFLPSCCGGHVSVVIETDDMGNEVLATKEGMRNKSKLSLATWLIGWDRLALALAMLKLLEYGIAMRYKQVPFVSFVVCLTGCLRVHDHCRWSWRLQWVRLLRSLSETRRSGFSMTRSCARRLRTSVASLERIGNMRRCSPKSTRVF